MTLKNAVYKTYCLMRSIPGRVSSIVNYRADMEHRIEDLEERFVPDIVPVCGEHRDQGAQVQQHVKKLRNLQAGHAQQVLGDGQVTGAGNRQKLRHALNQSQNDR